MLNESQRNRLLELFAEGVHLQAEARRAFVRRARQGDPVVGDELAELLEVVQARLDGFLIELPGVEALRSMPGFRDSIPE